MKHKHKLKRYLPTRDTGYFLWYVCTDPECYNSQSPLLFARHKVYAVVQGKPPMGSLLTGVPTL